MSFITKRERVFNDYDLFDLPSRNEGKLKAYASCTDARAWSHFCSDKTEHLVDIIKRNNETCRPKYIPTNVIVDTLMVAKNAEITRLKRKIEEFEQMMTVYDQLELTCDQKCEIANAHAAIKEANKELDEMFLDLDLSGFTEGIDSEAFETGKSRGDEPSRYRMDETPRSRDEWAYDKERRPMMETKGNQMGSSCPCDVSTSATDGRIEEMQESIIRKDAKLNAMQNTIAVMENDVCEPYCVYANIFTALEKIFGILYQNDKYRQYLDLLSAGKDTQCIDIKGKIVYKLKILEKFCLALIAPCSQNFTPAPEDCTCYQAKIVARLEATYALTSSECLKANLDSKRAHLVADIMENEEMKEILSKDSALNKADESDDDDQNDFIIDNCSINGDNLQRLKKLQENYDDLMTCYENLKHEKHGVQIRCQNYEGMEKELEHLKNQLLEYNALWHEKEHYRKRSVDLDNLKEQYLSLVNETTNLETQLKSETEINRIKCETVEDLRKENILLEKKLNEIAMNNEKEKNALECKLKEAECQIMCQDQQIKSLNIQIDKLIEQINHKEYADESEPNTLLLLNEIESLKEQVINLKDALCCNEEEKQNILQNFQEKLQNINELKQEIEDWKNNYENTFQRKEYLEHYAECFRDEIQKLVEENRNLSQDVEEKSTAIKNLMDVINNKSEQISELMVEIEQKQIENGNLLLQLSQIDESHSKNILNLETENKLSQEKIETLHQDKQILMDKVKDYDNLVQQNRELLKNYKIYEEENNQLKTNLFATKEEKYKLEIDLENQTRNHSKNVHEIKKLVDKNNILTEKVNGLESERNSFKTSLELTEKQSGVFKNKMIELDNLSQQYQNLKQSYEELLENNNELQQSLSEKNTNKELVDQAEGYKNLKRDFDKLRGDYNISENENLNLQNNVRKLKEEKEKLQQRIKNLEKENDSLTNKLKSMSVAEHDFIKLQSEMEEIMKVTKTLQAEIEHKTSEISNLNNILLNKDAINEKLRNELQSMHIDRNVDINKFKILQQDILKSQNELSEVSKINSELTDKLKAQLPYEDEIKILRLRADQVTKDKEDLEKEYHKNADKLINLEKENAEILSLNEELEKSLIRARSQAHQNDVEPMKLSYEKVIQEVDDLKTQKSQNQSKIRELYNKLDQSEAIISELSEAVKSREDKNAIRENYINELEEEVRKLHTCLDNAIDTGEQMNRSSWEKIDQSRSSMEAHHSKATHSLKLELEALKKKNMALESQLSDKKMETEETSRNLHKLRSEFEVLLNDNDNIATAIKQIEIKYFGDSILSQQQCNVEDVLNLLDKITKYFDTLNSKNTTLEQTLLKVQSSSQLLLTKADEGKRLVEAEKQKITNEIDETIKEKQNLEKQLVDLKSTLKNQISEDNNVIKDLKAEILNKDLIIEKINQSTQEYIAKLEDDIKSLQELYQNTIRKVEKLQDRIDDMTIRNEEFLKIIDKTKHALEEKSKELISVQKELETIKQVPKYSCATQTLYLESNTNKESQTTEYGSYKSIHKNYGKSTPIKISYEDSNKKLDLDNDIQVFNLKLEPSIKSKLKNLTTASMEQFSIETYIADDIDSSDVVKSTDDNLSSVSPSIQISDSKSKPIVDIYNKRSLDTNSSKNVNDITGTTTDYTVNNENASNCNLLTLSSSNKASKSFVVHKDDNSFNSSDGDQPRTLYSKSKLETLERKTKTFDTSKTEYTTGGRPLNEVSSVFSDRTSHKVISAGKNILSTNGFNDKDTTTIISEVDKNIEFQSSDIAPTCSSQLIHFVHSNNDSFDKLSDKQPVSVVKVSRKQKPNNSVNDKSPNAKPLKIPESSQDIILSPISTKQSLSDNTLENRIDNLKQSSSQNEPINIKANYRHFINEPKFEVDNADKSERNSFGMKYILGTLQAETNPNNQQNTFGFFRKSQSDSSLSLHLLKDMVEGKASTDTFNLIPSKERRANTNENEPEESNSPPHIYVEHGVMANLIDTSEYEKEIDNLRSQLKNVEDDYNKKIEAMKTQYDNNVKMIISEHNRGVNSLQELHEETVQDIKRVHENEIENLRSLSIEAMRKVERLKTENRRLKIKTDSNHQSLLDEGTLTPLSETKRDKNCFNDGKILTKTHIETFNVKPKSRGHGPCTCTVDISMSDTVRNIFEQVDADQRRLAEATYLKYIANKIMTQNLESLDAQELSFLHLKICRTWKLKLTKEENFQKKIDSLEIELMSKQRSAQQQMAELDRKVAEERRALQEIREAVFRKGGLGQEQTPGPGTSFPSTTGKVYMCNDCKCNTVNGLNMRDRRSAGDLGVTPVGESSHLRRLRTDVNKPCPGKLNAEERRNKKLYTDEPPTRLTKNQERPTRASRK